MNKCPKIVLFVLTAFLLFNFTTVEDANEAICNEEIKSAVHPNLLLNPKWVPFFTCGTYNSGTRYPAGYYTYPAQNLNLSCHANGATVNVYVSAHDVPNRFTIRKDGAFVTSSIWLGCASYAGPWGPSICNSGSATLSFTKSTGAYTIVVETMVQSVSDFWGAS